MNKFEQKLFLTNVGRQFQDTLDKSQSTFVTSAHRGEHFFAANILFISKLILPWSQLKRKSRSQDVPRLEKNNKFSRKLSEWIINAIRRRFNPALVSSKSNPSAVVEGGLANAEIGLISIEG